MAARQRRLAAIFFSDMKGFSSQMDADEEGTLDRLDRHNAVMRTQIEAHGGRVIKTVGDAFMAEFTSSVAAVKCALDCLRDFDTQNAETTDDEAIRVRIGVHVGDVVVEGDDLFGEAVNVAARLEPQAPVGGVCVSQAVYDQVRRKVHARGEVRSEVALKGIGEAMRLYALWPSAEHLDVVAIPAAPAPASAATPRWNLLILAGVAALAIFWAIRTAQGPPREPVEAKPSVTEARAAAPTPPPTAPLEALVERGGTLRVGWQGDWGPSFVPGQATRNVSTAVFDFTLDSLVRVTPSGQVEPHVVESVTVDPEGKEVTLTLRDGVSFHPHPCLKGGLGRSATAADVIASITLQNRFLGTTPVVGLAAYRAGRASRIEGLTIGNDGEVHMALDAWVAYPAHLLAKVLLVAVDDERPCQLAPPGTGPFVAAEPIDGNTLTMRRSPNYWSKPAHLDAITLTPVDDELVALQQMGEEAMDLLVLFRPSVLADLRAEQPQLAADFSELSVSAIPWVRHDMTMRACVFFVPNPGPTWGAAPRRALGYALDRDALSAAYPGFVVPAGRFLEPRLLGADPAIDGFTYDPERARQILAEAGYPSGEGLPPLKLGVKEDRREIGVMVVEQARAVGLPIKAVTVSGTGLAKGFEERSLDAAIVNLDDSLVGDDPYTMLGSLHYLYGLAPESAPKGVMIQLEEVSRERERARRGVLYGQIERALFEAPPYIPFAFYAKNSPVGVAIVRPRVRGARDRITGRLDAGQWRELWPKLWLADEE